MDLFNRYSCFRTGKGICILLLFLLFCAFSHGADLLSLPLPNPEAVIRLDLQKICKALQGKAQRPVTQEQFNGLIGPASELLDMEKYCSEVLISVASLRKNRAMIFCRTSLQEKEFRALLRQRVSPHAGIRIRPCGKSVLYEVTDTRLGAKSLFAVYLQSGVLLFCDRDPSGYLLGNTPKGLTGVQRSWLKNLYPVSGYIVPGKKTYRKNPFLPRFERILFHIVIQKDLSLVCRMEGPLAPGEDAELKMQQLRQTRLMAAILLNNVDPSLAEEFMQSGQVYRQNSTLFFHQYISVSFLRKIFLQGLPLLQPVGKAASSPAGTVKRKVDRP